MADEAVLVEDSGLNPVQRTITNGSTGSDIEKGTIMTLTNPNTVAASSTTGEEFGGILAAEKVGGDGSTTIGCHMNGMWDLTTHTGAAITIGEQVTTSGANLIRAATEAEVQLGQWIGYAMEDAAAATQEVILVTLRGG